MTEILNGKIINWIEIEKDGYPSFVKNTAEKENGYCLIYESIYMGDHSEDWVVQIDLNGKEVARYNTKFIKQIKWLL
jgi:hypothetical protein